MQNNQKDNYYSTLLEFLCYPIALMLFFYFFTNGSFLDKDNWNKPVKDFTISIENQDPLSEQNIVKSFVE